MNEQARTDRIDFAIFPDGAILVTKMTRHLAQRRDIPHASNHHAPDSNFDLIAALDWCRENGFTVETWPNHGREMRAARAWRGKPWPIRTGYQIAEKRRVLEAECMHYWNARPEQRESLPLPRWPDMTELAHADLAYVGEPHPTYDVAQNGRTDVLVT